MTQLPRLQFLVIALAWTAAAVAPRVAHSQSAQPTPPARMVPPAPQPAVAPALRVPNDSSVALCVDGAWIAAPGVTSDCARHGGLKVAMPPKRVVPPPPVSRHVTAALVAPAATPQTDQPPSGATARCKDGTFVSSTVDANTCAGNGGLAVRIPVPPPAPRRPTP